MYKWKAKSNSHQKYCTQII